LSVIVRVTRKYQITIPKKIREKLHIRVGDSLKMRVEGEKIIVEPIISRVEDPVRDMLSLIDRPLNIDAVRLVEESWDED